MTVYSVTITFYLFVYSMAETSFHTFVTSSSIRIQMAYRCNIFAVSTLLLSVDALTVLINLLCCVVMVSEIDGSISDLFPCFSKPSVSHSIYLCQGTQALSSPHVLCFSHYNSPNPAHTYRLSPSVFNLVHWAGRTSSGLV